MLSQNQIQLITNSFSQLTTNTNFVEISSVNFSISANNNFNYKGKSIKALTNLYSGKRALLFQDTNTKQYYAVGEDFNPTLSERSFTRKYLEEPIINRSKKIGYGAVFSVERPIGDCRFPELEMLQRTNLFTDDWFWSILGPVYDCLHHKDFYYWNGTRSTFLFTHTMSEVLSTGEKTFYGDDDTFETLFEKSWEGIPYSPLEESSVNNYTSPYYYVIFFTSFRTGGAQMLIGIEGIEDPDAYMTDEIIGTTYVQSSEGLYIGYAQVGYTASVSGFRVTMERNPAPLTVKWELRLVRTYGQYATFNKQGSVLGHWVNGFEGDVKSFIKYYVGNGPKPSTLLESVSIPNWDWRGSLITSDNPNFRTDYETTAYFADYYGSFNFGKDKKGLLATLDREDPDFSNLGRLIQRFFGYNPDTQELDTTISPVEYKLEKYSVKQYDGRSWDITFTGWARTKKFDPIPIPNFTGEIQDLCIPPVWITNRANGFYWFYPLFGAYYY